MVNFKSFCILTFLIFNILLKMTTSKPLCNSNYYCKDCDYCGQQTNNTNNTNSANDFDSCFFYHMFCIDNNKLTIINLLILHF